MERKDNLPKRVAPRSYPHQINGGGNITGLSSSSSNYSSTGPTDFLSQIHTALKHCKPLGSRAVRVLDPLAKPSKKSGAFAPPLKKCNAGKNRPPTAEMGLAPLDDSSLTPSITYSLNGVDEQNVKSNQFDHQNENSGMICHEKSSLVAFQSHLGLESQAIGARDGMNEVLPSALGAQKSSPNDKVVPENVVSVGEQGFHQQDVQKMDMSTSGVPFAIAMEKGKEQNYGGFCFQPATKSTLVRSSCVTTISVNSPPKFQCTGAPSEGQAAFPTQMIESSSQNLVSLKPPLPDGKRVVISEGPSMQHKQELHEEGIIKGVVADNAVCLLPQPPPTVDSSLKSDIKQLQASKTEKVNRRKKLDTNAFFSVNGKQYQKLEKIGSGGSSEVYKVISPDCTIYALKKIKLKGRDYATAYGFCQEIGYLDRLKGKSNIIHLIDYEVTDKALLQQAMEEFSTSRDGRITNDEYIYMVLEYGEIDLAHMLMQKFKDMDGVSWNINENWLRFYWQQILEAVNMIHEERIVHSDLKPANFLLVKGSLKLIDFGIAKAIRSDTTNIQRDAQAGTINYMSPEAFMWSDQDQAGGTIKCGRPSDIWSLGCILYQMVYGKTPFSEYKTFWAKFKVITDANHKIVYEPVPNPWLIDLMKRCLAWDHSKRWRIPQLLQHYFLVPPVPREVPSQGDHPYELLLHRVGFYWNDPEVSRLCSELICVVSKLEKDGESKHDSHADLLC